jgi:regulator of sigma E protease
MTGAPKKSFFVSLYDGLRETINAFSFIVGSFVDLISKIFTSPDAVKDVSGPIGIIMIAKQASNLGFVFFMQLMAIISIDLAVLNLMPFPALDGGRIVLVCFEKIKGRPLSLRTQTLINGAGFLLLITLMILVSIQDIGKYF